MSLWFRPASLLPRFVEEAMRDFRYMDSMMFGPLHRFGFPWETAEESAKEIINNDSKFAVCIDVSKFKPENLKVNIDGRQLTIEGKQEVQEDNGYSMRSFVRRVILPDNVNLDAVRSSLSDSGHLSIEAPKLARAVDSGRTIPIERTETAKPVTEAEKSGTESQKPFSVKVGEKPLNETEKQ
ncbi:unnamed protein product [Haemonchus placei]|uniref:SHSP domain-containing protein n=1 Tax=Haemonchus placei TaxID=6290 RepID=A0A0N4X6K1_HAEPC|nr:unnamed protein product [Haemonchus placei]